MECLPKAEILVRDDFYGRESRGNEVPLNRPKAKSVGCVVWQFGEGERIVFVLVFFFSSLSSLYSPSVPSCESA